MASGVKQMMCLTELDGVHCLSCMAARSEKLHCLHHLVEKLDALFGAFFASSIAHTLADTTQWCHMTFTGVINKHVV